MLVIFEKGCIVGAKLCEEKFLKRLESARMAKEGLLVQDDEGNLYFLRPEVLKAAKVEKSLQKDAQTALKAAKKGTAPKLKVLGSLKLVAAGVDEDNPLPTMEAKAVATRGAAVARRVVIKSPTTSTIMCPW